MRKHLDDFINKNFWSLAVPHIVFITLGAAFVIAALATL